jgi:hypothetical protein
MPQRNNHPVPDRVCIYTTDVVVGKVHLQQMFVESAVGELCQMNVRAVRFGVGANTR